MSKGSAGGRNRGRARANEGGPSPQGDPPEPFEPKDDEASISPRFSTPLSSTTIRVLSALGIREDQLHALAGISRSVPLFVVGSESPLGGRLLEYSARTPGLFVKRVLYQRHDGTKVLHNEEMRIDDKGRGIGLRVFERQVRQAQALGVSHMETVAARSSNANGYYTWAVFGYNGEVPEAAARRLPPSLSGAQTIHDILRTQAGRDWWRQNGTTFEGRFDLKPGSENMVALARYVAERKQRGG